MLAERVALIASLIAPPPGCLPHQVLGCSQSELSDAALRSLWKVLDRNGDGTCSAGEFIRFMKRGALPEGASPRAIELARR